MSNKTFTISEELYSYMASVSFREPDLLERLRRETASDPESSMQISPEQGQLMGMLVKLTGARRCIELGVFTGYSSLCVALALPEDGFLLACDVDEKRTAVARRYWQEAGVIEKISLNIGPAISTLDAELAEGRAGSYDFAFIDADKVNYIHYYERCLKLLRSGGLIVVDNVLWSGRVADPGNRDRETSAIRAFNDHVHSDQRIDLSMIPVSDGLTLCRVR